MAPVNALPPTQGADFGRLLLSTTVFVALPQRRVSAELRGGDDPADWAASSQLHPAEALASSARGGSDQLSAFSAAAH